MLDSQASDGLTWNVSARKVAERRLIYDRETTTSSQSCPACGGTGYAISSRNQGAAERNAARRRQTADPIRGGGVRRFGNRAHYYCYGPRQERDRRSFRFFAGAGKFSGEQRQVRVG